MKFLNYLMSKIDHSPSINDFIKVNKFYVYQDLISFNLLEKILKEQKTPDQWKLARI